MRRQRGRFSFKREPPPLNPPRGRQGAFRFRPLHPLTTKRVGLSPSFLDYPPRSSDGAAMPRPHAVRRQTSVTRASRSKARLRLVTNRRDSWRSHVHRTYIAQRVQFFELQSGNVRGRGGRPLVLSLGGCKGGYSLSRKRVSPFYALPHGAEISRACAEQFANGFVKPFPESLWQHKHRSPMRATANA